MPTPGWPLNKALRAFSTHDLYTNPTLAQKILSRVSLYPTYPRKIEITSKNQCGKGRGGIYNWRLVKWWPKTWEIHTSILKETLVLHIDCPKVNGKMVKKLGKKLFFNLILFIYELHLYYKCLIFHVSSSYFPRFWLVWCRIAWDEECSSIGYLFQACQKHEKIRALLGLLSHSLNNHKMIPSFVWFLFHTQQNHEKGFRVLFVSFSYSLNVKKNDTKFLLLPVSWLVTKWKRVLSAFSVIFVLTKSKEKLHWGPFVAFSCC